MASQIRRSAVLKVEAKLAWSVLCDFDQWQEWMPSIHESQVLVREGGVAVIELIADGTDKRILLEMIESPLVELRFTEVGRYGSHALLGRCRLDKNPDGSRGSLIVELEPGDPWWKRSRRRLAKRLLPLLLDAWKQRCHEVATSEFAEDPSGRQTLVEIFPSGSELILRLGDREYLLSEVHRP